MDGDLAATGEDGLASGFDHQFVVETIGGRGHDSCLVQLTEETRAVALGGGFHLQNVANNKLDGAESVADDFQAGAAQAGRRLRHFIDREAQATRLGVLFDDAATAQGLYNYFRLALSCGGLTGAEVEALTGLPASLLAGGR